MIYIFILFILFYFAVKKDRKGNKSLYFYTCVALIFFIGLSRELGGDRPAYIEEFAEIPSLVMFRDELWDFLQMKMLVGRMPLWTLTLMLFKSVTTTFAVFQFTHAVFVNGVIFWFFSRYSKCKFFCLFVYYCILYLNFNCEVMRESVAVSFGLLAMPSFLERHWMRYYMFCVLAFGFHASSIVLFFFPLITAFEITGKKIALITSAIVSFYFYGNKYLFAINEILGTSFLGNRFDQYFNSWLNINGLIYNVGLNFLFPSVVLYYIRRHGLLKDNPFVGRIIPPFLVLGACITAILTMNRLFNYFIIIQIVIYTSLLKVTTFKLVRCPIQFSLVIMCLFFSPQHSVMSYFLGYNYGFHRYDFYYPYTTVFDDTNVSYREVLRMNVLKDSSHKNQRE